MTNCHQWRRHVPMLRNPTPSGSSLTAKNTSGIWTSIWYHPRCLHKTQTQNILTADFISRSGVVMSRLFSKTRQNKSTKVGEGGWFVCDTRNIQLIEKMLPEIREQLEQRLISVPSQLFVSLCPSLLWRNHSSHSTGSVRSDAAELQGGSVWVGCSSSSEMLLFSVLLQAIWGDHPAATVRWKG